MRKVAVVGLMLALVVPMAFAQTSKTVLRTELAPMYIGEQRQNFDSLSSEQKLLLLAIMHGMAKSNMAKSPASKNMDSRMESILSKEVLDGLTVQDTQNLFDTIWAWKTFTQEVSQMPEENPVRVLQACVSVYEQLAKSFAKNENTDEAFVANNATLVSSIAQQFEKPIAVGWEEGKTIVISEYIAQHLPDVYTELAENETKKLATFNRDVFMYEAPVGPEPTEDEKAGESSSAPTASVHSEGYIIPAAR